MRKLKGGRLPKPNYGATICIKKTRDKPIHVCTSLLCDGKLIGDKYACEL